MSEKGNPAEQKWREAVRICGRILSDRAAFDNEETNYKLEISNRVKALFDALEKGEDFVPLLKKAFSSPNNLTSWHSHNLFIDWAIEYPDQARKKMLELMDSSKHSVDNRIDRFLACVLTTRSFAMGFVSIAERARSRSSRAQVAFLRTG